MKQVIDMTPGPFPFVLEGVAPPGINFPQGVSTPDGEIHEVSIHDDTTLNEIAQTFANKGLNALEAGKEFNSKSSWLDRYGSDQVFKIDEPPTYSAGKVKVLAPDGVIEAFETDSVGSRTYWDNLKIVATNYQQRIDEKIAS